jgi:hypothetical protein
MSTQPRRGRAAAAVPIPVGATPMDLFADFGREQMAMAMDASGAMFRGFESMRAIQQQAAQQAAARHEAAARKMRETAAPAELMAIPFGLLQSDLQSATRYWQDLAAAALETQTEMMGCASHLVDADSALQSVSAVEALEAIPGVRYLFPFAAGGLCPPPRRSA